MVTSPSSVYSNQLVTPDNRDPCLIQIPDDAKYSFYHDSSKVGTFVSYANGTEVFFDAAACPQPAPSALYDVAHVVVNDPRFVSAENGSTYFLDVSSTLSWGPLVIGFPNGTKLTYTELGFILYGDPVNPQVTGCGGSVVPISAATTHYYKVRQLVVKIPNNDVSFVNSTQVPNNLPSNIKGLDFSGMKIEFNSDNSYLNGFHCIITTSTSR